MAMNWPQFEVRVSDRRGWEVGWAPTRLSLDLGGEAGAWHEGGEGDLDGPGYHSLQPSLTLGTVPVGVVLGYTEDNQPEGEGWPEP